MRVLWGWNREGINIFLSIKESDDLLGHLEDDLELSSEEYKSEDRYAVVRQLAERMRALAR